jgi:hypothetical protein
MVTEDVDFKKFFRFMPFLLDRSSIGRRRLIHLTSTVVMTGSFKPF